MKLSFIFFLLQLFAFGYGYKILVTVLGLSGSQNLIMYRLAEILGKKGHEVTILKKEIIPEAKTPKLTYSKEIAYNAINDDEVSTLQIMKLVYKQSAFMFQTQQCLQTIYQWR